MKGGEFMALDKQLQEEIIQETTAEFRFFCKARGLDWYSLDKTTRDLMIDAFQFGVRYSQEKPEEIKKREIDKGIAELTNPDNIPF